jgi:hypothetical protein
MFTNKIINGKDKDLMHLFELYFVKSVSTVISGWLGEMDGETTEEDWRINTNHSKLDGKISSPSFKKVFKGSSSSIHHKR